MRALFIRGAGSQNGYTGTFAQKDEATYISRVIMQGRDLSIGNVDKDSNFTAQIGSGTQGQQLTSGLCYVRPYSISLLAVIKY